MTKRILAALMAAILLLSCACWAEEEEIYPACDFDLDAYGGTLNVVYSDGSIEETGGWGFSTDITEEGMTIGSMLNNFDIAEVEILGEDDVFEGWLVFDVEETEDEDGFSVYSYLLRGEEPITTEELLALPAQEGYVIFAAKWESIPAEEYFQDSEEDYEEIYFQSITLAANQGGILMHSEDEDFEIGMDVGTCEPGQRVDEVLELDRILAVTREGYEFAGWTVYSVGWMESLEEAPEDEDAIFYELYEDWYCVLGDAELIGEGMSTEEMGALVCGETDLFIAAGWK